jgi:hypothetical protein
MSKIISFSFALGLMWCGVSLAVTQALPVPPDYSVDQARLPLAVDELPLRNMPDLALKLLQQHQPELTGENGAHWLGWEKKRLQLMQRTAQWQAMVLRCAETAAPLQKITLENADRDALRTQCLQARLELGEYGSVMAELRTLMWQAGASTENIAIWRRMIIQAYLGMDALDDAERATRRYQQDYGENHATLSWQLTQAQVFMRTGRAQQAVELLSKLSQPQARAMLMLAQMQAKNISPAALRDKIKPLLDNPQTDDVQRVLWLYVRYQSALADQDQTIQIETLEQLLANRAVSNVYSIFSDARKILASDELWQAYEAYGAFAANQHQLLRGDDQAWHTLANSLAATQPVQARALYATLALQSENVELQQSTLLQLAEALEKQYAASGLEIVRQLYLQSSALTEVERVPVSVRYKLVDYAVARADLTTAAQLMEKLPQPPDGQDAFGWNLRRARVMILGGNYVESAKVLREIFRDVQLVEDQIDQYLQVVFDLQAVQQHRLALEMFGLLERQPLDIKHQRELAYWKAESLQKTGEFEQAAWLYLKSAQAPDGAQDPWYHTASFQAAEALAQAGLIQDARRQYSELLKITANPARQALIRQRLQDLLLQQGRKKSEVAK